MTVELERIALPARLPAVQLDSESLREVSGAIAHSHFSQLREMGMHLDLSAAQVIFIQDVILKETPVIPEHVKIARNVRADGTSVLEISHRSAVQGQEIDFSYQVEFTATKRATTPFKPSLTETNIIQVPANPPTSAEDLYHLQCAWRRVTIADPHLYATHAGGKVQMREYQEEGVLAGLDALARKEHPLLSMFTGTGKTHVGFEVMDRYLQGLPDQENRGKVIFLVNNRTILDEAAASLNRAKPGYKTSMCYDGVIDTSGDVIFATPGTLTGGALEEFLKLHKVAMVISDETHHLPAEGLKGFYNRVEEVAASKGHHTAFLGLTATPIRPDQKSVIGFFNSNVSFRYDYSRAYYEGYLPAIVHHGKDMDMKSHTGEFSKVPILPGGAHYSEHCRERYESKRIPKIVGYYEGCVAGKVDKRALAICPDVDTANDLSAGFNLSRIPAAALTSELTGNQADFKLFKSTYGAFKTGAWSPDKDGVVGDRPVPKVITSVSMFKEGIDVPGIGTVIFWTDTNSIITLTQGIGRGARPAPGKTHLDVLDVVGLYRKLEFIHFLAQFSDRDESEKKGGKGEAGKGKEFGLDDLSNLAKNSDAYDNNVTEVLRSFLDNVPNTLQQLYKTYPNIPRQEREHLDRFIMARVNDLTPDAAPKTMQELTAHAADLVSRWKEVPPRERVQLRKALYAAFSYEESNLDVETGDILTTPVTKIIYSRMFQLMQEANPKLPVDALCSVLHEFDPKHEAALILTAGNIRSLRERGFGLTSEKMTDYLIEKVLNTEGVLKETDSLTRGHLILERDGIARDNDYFLIDRAETARTERNVSVLGFSGGASAVLGSKEFQDAAIGGYLKLPEIQGKLTREDFLLDAKDFEELLVQRGLIKSISINPLSIEKGILSLSREFITACQSEDEGRARVAGTALHSFLTAQNTIEFVRSEPEHGKSIPMKIAKGLLILSDTLDVVKVTAAEGVQTEISKVSSAVEELLRGGGIRFISQPPELHGQKLVLQRRVDSSLTGLQGDFELRIEPSPGTLQNPELGVVMLRVREDATGRCQCFVERPGIRKPASSWENLHESLGGSGRALLAGETVSLIENLQKLFGGRFGMVITGDKVSSKPFNDLMDAVVQRTGWNVVGQIEDLTTNGGSYFSNAMLSQLMRSRSDVSAVDLAKYGDAEIGGARLPRLSAVLSTLYLYKSQIGPRYFEAKSVLDAASGTAPEKAVHQFLLGQLDRVLHNQGAGIKEMLSAKSILAAVPADPAAVKDAYPQIAEAGFRLLEAEGNRHGSPICDRYSKTFAAANACLREIEHPPPGADPALGVEFRQFMRESVEMYALVQRLPEDFSARTFDYKARLMALDRRR